MRGPRLGAARREVRHQVAAGRVEWAGCEVELGGRALKVRRTHSWRESPVM
jgi:hypothetical protein